VSLRHPILQALVAIVLWSSLAALGTGLKEMPPFLLVGTTLVLGSIPGLRRVGEWKVPPRTLLLGVYGLFGYHFCLFMALRLAPPLQANLLNYLWPLLIVVLSPLFFKGYRLRWSHIAGAMLGFAGAGLIVTGGKFEFDTSALPGYALAAIAAVIWSTYSLMTKKVKRFPNAAIGLFCLVSGLLALVIHIAIEPAYPVWIKWQELLILGLGPMGAAFFAWDHALKHGDPRVIGSLAYLTPMLSTILLALSGRGVLDGNSVAAMGLIVAGAALGSSRRY
jgi:drug/metabolite transporter (DMT)-like permease